MGYRTLSISLFVIVVMSMSTVMGYLADEIPGGRSKFFVVDSGGNIENLTGIAADRSGLENMSIGENPQDELSQSGLSFKSYNLLSMLWSVCVNSTWGFGDYLLNYFEIPRSPSANALATIISWMLMFNHAIALYQIVFRPMGGEA